jgi:hypothetical protein
MLGLNESLIKTEFRGKIHKYDPDDIENIILDCYKQNGIRGIDSQNNVSLNESQQVELNKPLQTVESAEKPESTDYKSLVDFILTVKSGGTKE